MRDKYLSFGFIDLVTYTQRKRHTWTDSDVGYRLSIRRLKRERREKVNGDEKVNRKMGAFRSQAAAAAGGGGKEKASQE